MILPIVQVGDPVLRARAAAIAPSDLPSLSGLITDMQATMRDAPGVGLAAPQIGRSLQLAVIEDTTDGLTDEQRLARERRSVPFHVIVNPSIQPIGDEVVLAYEGCLSFKGFVMVVPRARRVRVEALDEHGTPVVIEASGWYARILQHEIDHLHGIVCCDRMDPRTLSTVENRERFPPG
ncbi:MAG: peptide deformylase [Deltaproteobacteria bacterium]|nr:peptide deformylase [Deltaproteobacteria bacterium]